MSLCICFKESLRSHLPAALRPPPGVYNLFEEIEWETIDNVKCDKDSKIGICRLEWKHRGGMHGHYSFIQPTLM